jgi:NDP-sugar pyrophosphorylase family protein
MVRIGRSSELNIVMPMAGLGKRLAEGGYSLPKPLVKVAGKTLIEWSVKSLDLNANYIFCCKQSHIDEYQIDETLKELVPNCTIVSIDYQTKGTAQTVLEASKYIDNDEELIISDTDHYILLDKNKFLSEIYDNKIDAYVFVFPDKQKSPHFSYVKTDEENYVIEAAEKIPISETAACGIHYYKRGSDFVQYAKKMIKKNIKFNDEFYVTPVYNEFVKDNKKISIFPIIKKWALGNPEEIKLFLNDFETKLK